MLRGLLGVVCDFFFFTFRGYWEAEGRLGIVEVAETNRNKSTYRGFEIDAGAVGRHQPSVRGGPSGINWRIDGG